MHSHADTSLFRNLLTKTIIAILDGDTKFSEYTSKNGKTIPISLPYLSGPMICEISTRFGHPIVYGEEQLSRWMYMERVLKHCIEQETCQQLLVHLFSQSQFQRVLIGLDLDDMKEVYNLSTQEALKAINAELVFSKTRLVFRSGEFVMEADDSPLGSLEDALQQSNDPFSELHSFKRCELLGSGGFGTVYRYHNHCLDMDFAVKIYDPVFVSDSERTDGERRFFREAKMLLSLNHPNIVRVFDAGRVKGKPFIRMEFIDGKTLEAFRNEQGNFAPSSALRAMRQIVSGLECAHKAGIIHRDLKPSNIMVHFDSHAKVYECKIIDFGVSAFMDTEGYTKLTRTGETITGGQFIDPLLQDNPALRDVRSDIYSIGAILFFLLCGRAPVGSNSESFLIKSNSTCTPELLHFIQRSTSIDINDRYSSCQEVLKELTKLLG